MWFGCVIRRIEVLQPSNQANLSGQLIGNLELAAQSLTCLMETTELFPSMIKIDLYGGIFSIYESIIPTSIALMHYRGVPSVQSVFCGRGAKSIDTVSEILPKAAALHLSKSGSEVENTSIDQKHSAEPSWAVSYLSYTSDIL